MPASLQALLRLAVLQRLGVFICALATLLATTSTASALEPAQTKTRVWDFDFVGDNSVGLFRAASSGKHQGNWLAGAEEASGSLLAARGASAITKGEQVTEQVIREAMKDAPLASQQAGGVSLPKIQGFVDDLLAGRTAPPIKVDGSMIVDGNHRYIAGRILGQEPAIQPWLGGRPGSAVPWGQLPIDPKAWP